MYLKIDMKISRCHRVEVYAILYLPFNYLIVVMVTLTLAANMVE